MLENLIAPPMTERDYALHVSRTVRARPSRPASFLIRHPVRRRTCESTSARLADAKTARSRCAGPAIGNSLSSVEVHGASLSGRGGTYGAGGYRYQILGSRRPSTSTRRNVPRRLEKPALRWPIDPARGQAALADSIAAGYGAHPSSFALPTLSFDPSAHDHARPPRPCCAQHFVQEPSARSSGPIIEVFVSGAPAPLAGTCWSLCGIHRLRPHLASSVSPSRTPDGRVVRQVRLAIAALRRDAHQRIACRDVTWRRRHLTARDRGKTKYPPLGRAEWRCLRGTHLQIERQWP